MHGTNDFGDCQTMGELTARHITMMLDIPATETVWEEKY
jgi:hypothetical protein